MGPLLTELNYSMLSWAILCNILEMADVETPNNRATSANDIPDFLTVPLSLNGLVESCPDSPASVVPQWLFFPFGTLA